MARYRGTVRSQRSQQETFDYLADFRSTAEWDPSIEQAELLAGEPGTVGARYLIAFRQLGRTTRLEYLTTEVLTPSKIVYRAETSSLTSTDTVAVDEAGTLTYDAHLELRGWRKALDPLAQLMLTRASEKARGQLAERLGSTS